MKIIIPTHEFTDNPNSGLAIETWNIAYELARLGNEITIITGKLKLNYTNIAKLEKDGIKIINHGLSDSVGLDYLASTSAFLICIWEIIILRNKYDWIFIIDNVKTPFLKYSFGCKLAIRFFNPNTAEVNTIFNGKEWRYDQLRKNEIDSISNDSNSLKKRIIGLLSFTIIPYLTKWPESVLCGDLNICINMDTKKYYESKLKNVVYIPDGVEDYRLNKIGKFYNNNKFIYLFIGKLGMRKGINNLIRVFKSINKKHPETILWLIGSSSIELLDKWRILSGPLLNKSIFFIGEVDRSRIGMYIKSSDVIVDTFFYAAFPNVIAEGMYCEKPVIAPKFGGAKDFVNNEAHGFLVDSRDVGVLYEKMEYLLLRKKNTKIMGQQGKLAISKLTWKKIAEKIEHEMLACTKDRI